MPRTIPAPASPVTTEIVSDADEAVTQAIALAQSLGYELPGGTLDANQIQRDIASNMRRSVEAVLEIGKGLLVLKAACPHGEFMRRLEALCFDQRAANRFMQSAVKFSKWSTSTTLLPKIDTTSKLIELLVLDDEELAELAETGFTGELALDEIAKMGVRELRNALRESRAEKEAAEAVSAKNMKRAQQLETALEKANRAPQEQISVEEAEKAREEGRRRAEIQAKREAAVAAIKTLEEAATHLEVALKTYFDLYPPECPAHRAVLNVSSRQICRARNKIDDMMEQKWDGWVAVAHRENDEPQEYEGEWQRQLAAKGTPKPLFAEAGNDQRTLDQITLLTKSTAESTADGDVIDVEPDAVEYDGDDDESDTAE